MVLGDGYLNGDREIPVAEDSGGKFGVVQPKQFALTLMERGGGVVPVVLHDERKFLGEGDDEQEHADVLKEPGSEAALGIFERGFTRHEIGHNGGGNRMQIELRL